MMRLFLFGWSATLLMLTPAWAQIRDFPYEGLVESEGAYVRSGPGKQFYPTGQLKRGTRVTVHRHDPGGWYMIAPPPASFSWVRAEYVRKTAPNRGLITENNVVIRVGSVFGDETRNVEQVRLSKNDQVEVLEEKTLSTPAGAVLHLKIAPPAGEYRWMSGKYITPVNQIVQKQQDQNPFAVPSEAKQPPAAEAPTAIAQNEPPKPKTPPVFEQPEKQEPDDLAVWRRGPDPQVLASQRQRLEELDDQFRSMVNGRTGDWEFTPLEQGYRQLQEQAAPPAIANQIELRFNAIDRYREIKKEYDELVKLTEETRKRDAQLMSMQQKQASPDSTPAQEEPLEPEPDPFAQTREQIAGPVELPGVEPVEPDPQNAQQPPPPQTQTARPVPRFDGAGIVRRAAAAASGAPAYVLVAPLGRVLAYLQPVQGLNLEPFVGKAMGIYGQRSYRADLRTDYIIVRSLMPVRLAP